METYKKVVAFLKSRVVPHHDVSVRRVRLNERLDGDCRPHKGGFLIRINRSLPEHEAIETVLHETAHVLAWELCGDDEHCDQWGLAYSRVYRAFLKEFFTKE